MCAPMSAWMLPWGKEGMDCATEEEPAPGPLSASVVRLSGMGIEGSEAASRRIVNLLKEELSFVSNLYTWWFNCSVDARG